MENSFRNGIRRMSGVRNQILIATQHINGQWFKHGLNGESCGFRGNVLKGQKNSEKSPCRHFWVGYFLTHVLYEIREAAKKIARSPL